MQEPHVEDVANHNDPESCGVSCEVRAEALTGGNAGQRKRMGTAVHELNAPHHSGSADGVLRCAEAQPGFWSGWRDVTGHWRML
jgi:hypothetical protein